jgi:ferric-dicitrate binding protein FerR (iron transport regulator)
VEAQLDLYAVGESPEHLAAEVRRHLERCPACARALEESRRLVGLLDLRFQEADRLARLQARLRAEERPRRSAVILRFARQAGPLAALLLLTVALYGSMKLPGAEGTVARGGAERAFSMLGKPQGLPDSAPGPKEVAAPDVVLWTTPHGPPRSAALRELEWDSGPLLVRVRRPAGVKEAPVFTVRTPAGTVTASQAAFLVTVRRVSPDARPTVDVRVYSGEVELAGRRGGPGDLLLGP